MADALCPTKVALSYGVGAALLMVVSGTCIVLITWAAQLGIAREALPRYIITFGPVAEGG